MTDGFHLMLHEIHFMTEPTVGCFQNIKKMTKLAE